MSDVASAGITIFAGRFGSGKTEAAINYALSLARGSGLKRKKSPHWTSRSSGSTALSRVFLIDLDIVTPYFRSREATEAVRAGGVDVIAPSVVGQHLHTPAITPQILGTIEQAEHAVVLDVGGDRQGARALGQFSSAIHHRGYTMHFMVNPYRPFTDTPEGVAQSVAEIEASSRLRVTSLVSNPNLIGETGLEVIAEGHARIEMFARQLWLPIAFVCVERRLAEQIGTNHFAQPVLPLDRFFAMSWE